MIEIHDITEMVCFVTLEKKIIRSRDLYSGRGGWWLRAASLENPTKTGFTALLSSRPSDKTNGIIL